ncbi:MAG: cytochrome c oxidase subunit II [Actinobacteria bacterium]|jgi:cytochrome c oxidase subunit 2|nr:cytochrome c oxidase subunit II [Actinomycetota bacterium]
MAKGAQKIGVTRSSQRSGVGKRAHIILVAPIILALSGCSSEKLPALGFPRGVTDINDISLSLWQGAWVAAFIVGAFTAVLILWAALRYRVKRRANVGGREELPEQVSYHLPLEIIYTVIPFIIVAVLFYFTARDQSTITKISPAGVAVHEIDVNAVQWAWQFTYPEAEDKTVTGTPEKLPTLFLPIGERIRINLTASDVVHSIWIPAFMMQMQALPYVKNQFEFTAQKEGTYPGFCNMHCGRNHSQMRFTVKVVSPAEYQNYINALKGGVA